MTSYSTWMLCRPAVETAFVITLPSRVQVSLLLDAPLPVETMSPEDGSLRMVPGDNVPDCHAASVHPLVPTLRSLVSTVIGGGLGVAATCAAREKLVP